MSKRKITVGGRTLQGSPRVREGEGREDIATPGLTGGGGGGGIRPKSFSLSKKKAIRPVEEGKNGNKA